MIQANKVALANFLGLSLEREKERDVCYRVARFRRGRSSGHETTYGEGNTLLDLWGRLDSNLINTSLVGLSKGENSMS